MNSDSSLESDSFLKIFRFESYHVDHFNGNQSMPKNPKLLYICNVLIIKKMRFITQTQNI